MNHPTRNKMLIRRNTILPIISIRLIIPPDDNATIIPITQATPRAIKVMAPNKSCFQHIVSIINKISDGMLCINNPINISLKFEAESKTSNEKIARKRANKIMNILGAQNRNLLIFFSILKHQDVCIYKIG